MDELFESKSELVFQNAFANAFPETIVQSEPRSPNWANEHNSASSTKPPPKKTTFILKLESLLENEPQFFNWSPNGKAIVIRGLYCEGFGEMLSKYRGSSKPATFLRNLNTYNFKKMPSIIAGPMLPQGTCPADQYEVYANPAFSRNFKDVAALQRAVYRDKQKRTDKHMDRKTRRLMEMRKDREISRLRMRVLQLENELETERQVKRSRDCDWNYATWGRYDSGFVEMTTVPPTSQGYAVNPNINYPNDPSHNVDYQYAVNENVEENPYHVTDFTDVAVGSVNAGDFNDNALEIVGPSPAMLPDIDMEKIVSEWITYMQ